MDWRGARVQPSATALPSRARSGRESRRPACRPVQPRPARTAVRACASGANRVVSTPGGITRVGCPRPPPGGEHLQDRLAIGHDPARSRPRPALEPAERQWVRFVEVLKRREHQRNPCAGPPGHLRGRRDIGFLPAVHQIPWLAKQGAQRPTVGHEMNRPAAVDRHGRDRASFARARLECVPAEVAVKSCGSSDRHVPFAGARKGIRESPVGSHGVRMTDRQEPLSPACNAHSKSALARWAGAPASSAGASPGSAHAWKRRGCARRARHRRRVCQRTGLRDLMTSGNNRISSRRIHTNPPRSFNRWWRRITK